MVNQKMRWILLVHAVFSLGSLYAQNNEISDTMVFVSNNETPPTWTQGTNEEMLENIYSRINYPSPKYIEGRTILQFAIDTLGQVQEPRIRRSIAKEIDEQLLKLICDYEFEPGMIRGKKADVTYTLPFRFSVSQE